MRETMLFVSLLLLLIASCTQPSITAPAPGGVAVATPRTPPATRSPTTLTAEPTFRPRPLAPEIVGPAPSPWAMEGHDGRRTRQTQYEGPRFGTKTLWEFTPTPDKKWDWFEGSPVIGPDETVYAGAGNYLYAVNPDGSLKWRFETRGKIASAAAVRSDGTVYIVSPDGNMGSGHLYAVSRAGTLSWEFALRALANMSVSPVIGADGTVYLYGDALYAVNYDGTLRWKFDPQKGSQIRYGGRSSPAVGTDGTIYFGILGSLFAVDGDGEREWETVIGEKAPWTDEYSAAIGPDGTIYAGSNDGYLHAINADGTPKWRSDVKTARHTFPAIGSEGTIYLVSEEGYLHALNPDGSLKWRNDNRIAQQASPVLDSEGKVYWDTIGKNLHTYRASGPSLYGVAPPRGPQVAVVRRSSYDYGWAKQDEVEFQATGVGASNASVLTIFNYGDEPAKVESIIASMPDFVASPSTFAIQPQSSQEFAVTFRPSQIADRVSTVERKQATLTIRSNAPPVTVKLSGMSANQLATISTDYHDFGPVAVGQSRTMTLAISNTAIVPLSVTGIVPTSSDLEAFPASFSVPPKSSQDILVTFRPSRPGGRWETLDIKTNDSRNPTRSVRLTANFQKLYLLPDSTMGDSPYDGEMKPIVLTSNLSSNPTAEWKYRLRETLKSPDYLVSLRAGVVDPSGGQFKLELILDAGGSQTVLASDRIAVDGAKPKFSTPSPGLPPQSLGWSTEPRQATVSLKGTSTNFPAGGTLILRVTNLKQDRLGIIEIMKDEPSYVGISSN